MVFLTHFQPLVVSVDVYSNESIETHSKRGAHFSPSRLKKGLREKEPNKTEGMTNHNRFTNLQNRVALNIIMPSYTLLGLTPKTD